MIRYLPCLAARIGGRGSDIYPAGAVVIGILYSDIRDNSIVRPPGNQTVLIDLIYLVAERVGNCKLGLQLKVACSRLKTVLSPASEILILASENIWLQGHPNNTPWPLPACSR